ncbi:hypothetical protein Zmor_010562 [Zophobas morio]|uniref:NADP-dependent oxidoreductase domain-containing protein n=1 Tax=Zophobas morio TaxID=2755281 RepID=A0AA38IJB7_9CUCU|nr:hypothetical protein Zmor_010562 [Zophobas morio]
MAANIFLDLPGGLKMPALGFGTWQAKNEQEIKNPLNTALKSGYRHIDTAFVYENEKFIGEVLKQWFVSGKLKRKDVFITTKLPMQGVHPDRVETFMKKSLENLQLDYVDLYLIHFPVGFKCDESSLRPKLDDKNQMIPEAKTDHLGIWKKMEEQVDAGRTKTIGLSNYNISQIETVLKGARIKPANLQVELHVYLQQRQLVDFCHKNELGREERQLPDILGDAVVAKISKKHSKTPAQIVLRFLIQRGIAPIPKSVTEKRVKENIAVFDFALSDSDIKELLGLDVGEKARVCNFKLLESLETHPDFPMKG